MENKKEETNSKVITESNISNTYLFLMAIGVLINLIALSLGNTSILYAFGYFTGAFIISRLIAYLYFLVIKGKSKRYKNITQAIIFLTMSIIALIRIVNYNPSSSTLNQTPTTLPQTPTLNSSTSLPSQVIPSALSTTPIEINYSEKTVSLISDLIKEHDRAIETLYLEISVTNELRNNLIYTMSPLINAPSQTDERILSAARTLYNENVKVLNTFCDFDIEDKKNALNIIQNMKESLIIRKALFLNKQVSKDQYLTEYDFLNGKPTEDLKIMKDAIIKRGRDFLSEIDKFHSLTVQIAGDFTELVKKDLMYGQNN